MPGPHGPLNRPRALAVGSLVAAAVGVASRLADPGRRERLRRTARVWRLTTRRGLAFLALKLRGAGAGEEERARLEERFAIRTAEDVARELGSMKGAMMKVGQMVSFIADGLPPAARDALATLQADVPPMSPSLAAGVVRDELGDDPERLFLDWSPVPVAAASIGQVHRAVLRDGREVAVKVQYPGIDRAIESDLDNAQVLYGLLSAAALPSLDVRGVVDELRARMADELDYRIEARRQAEFADRYAGHPFVSVPAVVPERSGRRVLTSEWVDGMRFADLLTAPDSVRQRAAEIVFRFAQGSIHRHRVFNGDPHPGNYRFVADGPVRFLDFGLVKRWTDAEWDALVPVIDPLLDEDHEGTVAGLERAGFLHAGHGLDPRAVWEYVSVPYKPFLTPEHTFDPSWTRSALTRLLQVRGPYADVVAALDMPPSFVILDRVVWGVSAILGQLRAAGPWRGILDEYRVGGPPATGLGTQEAAWRAPSPRRRPGSR